MDQAGSLIIVSGPSGAGKSALAARVLESVSGLRFSVSYTTRAPRGFERDGIEYHFVDMKSFKGLIEVDGFLEWAEVYGNLYGTSKRSVDDILCRGEDVLLDVDVQGARSIRQKRQDAVTVFILPPSYQVLRDRLESRKLDKDYVIEQRLRIACSETRNYRDYDYLIVNDDLDKATEELRSIVMASRCRMEVRTPIADRIVATFGGVNAENP